MTKFRLSKKFLEKYEGKQPKWGFGDLSYFVFVRTYSRLKENGKKETAFEVFKRVVEGSFQLQLDHCLSMGLPWDAYKSQRTAQDMFTRMWEMKLLPPGRGLWMSGTDKVKELGSAALSNCGFVSTENIDKDLASPFAWACDMLMLGVGVGFDTLGATSGNGSGVIPQKPVGNLEIHKVGDSREGWVEAVRALINSYSPALSKITPNAEICFDFSWVRAAGEPIKGFGGTASGPGPLKEGLENIKKILETRAESESPLTSVDITDIMNYIGKFVVAGNVRRSAELSIGLETDEAFRRMKDPVVFEAELEDRRWASNNSLDVTENSNFIEYIDSILTNGEPGLVFLENSRSFGRFKDGRNEIDKEIKGFNPCVEIGLHDREMCNLAEIFPANHDDVEDFKKSIKIAYLYAKSITLLKSHDPGSNSAMLRNRRIGLSQSGIQQAIKKFGRRYYFKEFCDKAYDLVQYWDNVYSRWLGIPKSIKTTCIKPSGTISLLAGATPGVHCTHSEYYLRSVRVASNDPLVKDLEKANYRIEPSITDKKGTVVVYFPIKEENFTKSKYDISVWEQLALVKELQHSWADNAVSVTVTIREAEHDQLLPAIEYYAPYVKSLSFLPLDNHQYKQPPYQSISKEEYEKYAATLKPLKLGETGDAALGSKFCDGDKCDI